MSKSKNFFEALYCPTDGSTPFTSKPFFLIKSRISPVPEPTSSTSLSLKSKDVFQG